MVIPAFLMHEGETRVFEKEIEENKKLKISCNINKINNHWRAVVELTISTPNLALASRKKAFDIDGHKFIGIYRPLFENKGITENFANDNELTTSPFSPEVIGIGYSDRSLLDMIPFKNAVVLAGNIRGFSSSLLNSSANAKASAASLADSNRLSSSVMQTSATGDTTTISKNTATASPTSSSRLLTPAKQTIATVVTPVGYGTITNTKTHLESQPTSSSCIIA